MGKNMERYPKAVQVKVTWLTHLSLIQRIQTENMCDITAFFSLSPNTYSGRRIDYTHSGSIHCND